MRLSNNPIFYLSRRVWKYSAGNRRNVALYFILFLIANLLSLCIPLIIGKVFNVIQQQGVDSQSLRLIGLLLAGSIGLYIAFWLFHGPARIIEKKNAFLVRANYKRYLLEGVMDFPIAWHSNHHSGDTIDRIEKGTRAIFDFSRDTFMIIQAFVRLVVSIIILAYFNIFSLYILSVIIIVAIFLVMRFDKILAARYKKIFGQENKISEKIFDVISNITTIILLRVEKLAVNSIQKKIMEPLGFYLHTHKINELKWFLVSLCSSAMTAMVIFSYLYSSLRSGSVILAGTVFVLYGYVDRISDLFSRFASMYGEILQQASAVSNAEEIAIEFSEKKKTAKTIFDQNWKELKIESLEFSYETKEEGNLHLDDISLSFKKGERVALIGESGSGKTTFLKVVRELYTPNKGSIYLNGSLLKEGFGAISEEISLIPQDPEIFSTTIKENITLGANCKKDLIKKFTDMACFTKVVEQLPHGLDSFIFEKGVNLSGGEKQRLALSRGLLASANKSIIMLDEPTSSMDMKNELDIFKNIFAEFPDKTIIASIHRLHLLSLFDRVYFFKSGKIIASGPLDELLATSPEFQKMWAKSRHHEKNININIPQAVTAE